MLNQPEELMMLLIEHSYLWYEFAALSLQVTLQYVTAAQVLQGITDLTWAMQSWQWVPYLSGCRAQVMGVSLKMVVPTGMSSAATTNLPLPFWYLTSNMLLAEGNFLCGMSIRRK